MLYPNLTDSKENQQMPTTSNEKEPSLKHKTAISPRSAFRKYTRTDSATKRREASRPSCNIFKGIAPENVTSEKSHFSLLDELLVSDGTVPALFDDEPQVFLDRVVVPEVRRPEPNRPVRKRTFEETKVTEIPLTSDTFTPSFRAKKEMVPRPETPSFGMSQLSLQEERMDESKKKKSLTS